jgi:hypothetical protein
MSRKKERFERRLAKRRIKQRFEEQNGEIKHPLGDPRIGNDRRQQERRTVEMTPAEVDDWLKRNGILGGDRRIGQRRLGNRRRR